MDCGYLKLIFRKFRKDRIYSVINVAGLAIALTAALLIYGHVVKEWKTDRFHANISDIYRMTIKWDYSDSWTTWTSAPTGPYTKEEIPGIKNFARVCGPFDYDVKPTEITDAFKDVKCIFTDKQFFDMFSFPLSAGNIEVGQTPDWAVVSENVVQRYFSGKNPVGETIWLKNPNRNDDQGRDYRIVAVMHNIPAASTLQADIIADFSNMEKASYNSWGMHGVYTYFQLDKNTDPHAIEIAIPKIVEKNYHWLKASEQMVALQPLQDIYFGSDHILEEIPHGSKRLNMILCGITLLILILASCNYIMIRIARLNRGVSGWAVRRCFGAGNRHLRRQLFLETIVYVSASLVFTIGMTIFLHPFFVRVVSPKFPYSFHFSGLELALFLTLLLIFALFITAVLYFYMLRYFNGKGIKEMTQPIVGNFDIKKILSVAQMAIFCMLFCCSIVLVRQMDFIRNRKLGFDTKNVITFNWYDRNLNVETLRSEFMRNPDILSVSNGVRLPFAGKKDPGFYSADQDVNKSVSAYMVHGDAGFLDTYDIKLYKGRNIDRKSYPVDREDFFKERPVNCPEILVNREFVKHLGLKEPIGTIISGEDSHAKFRIVGVVEDFHFQTLYEGIKPMYIVYDIPSLSASMLVRYREGRRQQVIADLERQYEQKFGNSDFSYWEYDYSQLYDKDVATVKLINSFTLIALLIGGMGIFAFSIFMAENRIKEVAMRKINGATDWQVIKLLNRSFVVRVLLACVIGLPVAAHAMTKWLEGFAYRVTLDWWLYVLVVAVCVVFVLVIITWQTWTAANVNPVKVLKSE